MRLDELTAADLYGIRRSERDVYLVPRTDDLPRLLPNRHAPREIETLIERVRTVQRDGVLAIVSIEEAGQLSVSAPVRDASGSVVAAACLVGSYEVLGPRRAQLERAALALAAAVTAELRSPAFFGDTDGYPS